MKIINSKLNYLLKIPYDKFVKSKSSDQPEQICTEEAQREASHKVAWFIRKEILNRDNWVFTGTFDNFENPPMLHTLLKWILLVTSNHVENMKHVEKVLNVQYQLLVTSLLIQ